MAQKKSANGVNAPAHKSEEIPEFLQTLLEGNGVGIREKLPYPFVKPDWLDIEKWKRGQRFAMDNLFGVMFSTGVLVMLTYTYQIALQPITFTRKSSTPFTAFKRYLRTISYFKSWYEHDILEPGNVGHQNIKAVIGMHERVKQRLTTEPAEEVESKVTNEGGPMWTEFHEELLEDFQACPELKIPITGEKQVFVSQADMTVLQFAFVGMVACFPKLFGIHNASDEDVDAYLHHWRLVAYLMGVEDRYNLCAGDVATVRQRCRDILELWLKPSLRTASRDWLHMSRCMIEGIGYFAPGCDFQVNMLYCCTQLLNIPATRLRATLSFKQTLMYHFNVFFFKYLARIPGLFTILNSLTNSGINKATKKSPSEIKRLKELVYPYEIKHRASSCPMMQ